MTERLAVDPATLRTLTEQLTAISDDLAAVAIPGVTPAPGSGLGGVDGPRRAAADVQRLGAAVRDWAASARRSLDQFLAADEHTADRLQH